MNILKKSIYDFAKCIVFGLIISVGIGVVVALISGLASGFDSFAMLNALRSVMLIVGAILLFIVAGMLLSIKGNKKIRSSEKWKSTFRIFGPAGVFLTISIVVLSMATFVDYIVWNMIY